MIRARSRDSSGCSRGKQKLVDLVYLRQRDGERDRRDFLFLVMERNSRPGIDREFIREADRSISPIDNAQRQKGVPEFRKTKRKGKQPFSASRHVLSSSLSFSLSLSLSLSSVRRSSRTSIPRFPFFLPPPALSLRFSSPQHGFLIGPIISARSSSRKLIRIFYYETENS